MKKFLMLFAALFMLCLAGCQTSPEYFEELSHEELNVLRNAARMLALKGNAVPAHVQAVFVEMQPYERIIYDGNKHGKASFRWEIYDVPADMQQLTQKDINPYWVMVYATGDLRDPQWKLTHAQETPIAPTPRGNGAVPPARNRSNAPATVTPSSGRTAPAAPPVNSRPPTQRGRIRR